MIFYQNIPEELKALPHWVLYRKDIHKNKISIKLNGEHASINKPGNGVSWENLLNFLKENLDQSKIQFDGIGFIFKPDLNFVFIDFDHMINDQGNVDPEVEQIIEKLDFHTEIFQSKPGVKL